jgi:hypothetical protein
MSPRRRRTSATKSSRSPECKEALSLLRRRDLSEGQLEWVAAMLAGKESESFDVNLVHDWSALAHEPAWMPNHDFLRVVWSETRCAPVGLLHLSGGLDVKVSIWIAPLRRGQGYARRTAEVLAEQLARRPGARVSLEQAYRATSLQAHEASVRFVEHLVDRLSAARDRQHARV